MLNLKSKETEPNGMPKEFAVLVYPDWLVGKVHNDEQLYKQLYYMNKVVIRPKDILWNLGEPVTLTPAEFQAKWKGD
jgi:hypothetical protein